MISLINSNKKILVRRFTLKFYFSDNDSKSNNFFFDGLIAALNLYKCQKSLLKIVEDLEHILLDCKIKITHKKNTEKELYLLPNMKLIKSYFDRDIIYQINQGNFFNYINS